MYFLIGRYLTDADVTVGFSFASYTLLSRYVVIGYLLILLELMSFLLLFSFSNARPNAIKKECKEVISSPAASTANTFTFEYKFIE